MDYERIQKVTDMLSRSMDEAEVYHSGIVGMKWGRRRYQNKDGSLTPAGRERYRQLYSDRLQDVKNRQQDARERLKEKRARDKMADNLRKEEEKLKQMEDELRGVKPKKNQDDAPKQSSQDGPKAETPPKPKTMSEMSDDELRAAINRMNLESQYRQKMSELNPQKVGLGKKLVNDVLIPGLKDAGKQIVKDSASKLVAKGLESLLTSDNKKTTDKAQEQINALKKQGELAKVTEDAKKRQKEAEEQAKKAQKAASANKRKAWNNFWDSQAKKKKKQQGT